MKREIELKNIAGYLPYGLKVCIGDSDIERTLTALSYDTHFAVVTHYVGSRGKEFKSLEHIKPILRPISDLLIDEFKTELEDLWQGRDDDNWMLNAISDGHDWFEGDTFNLSYRTIQFCYKNHIDIHGLIKKGLAVDGSKLATQA